MTDMLDKKFLHNPDIVARKILDEMILVPIKGNLADMQKIFSLNSVADFVWSRLDGHNTVRSIIESVVEAFDVESEQASSDVIEFVEELNKEGLIVDNGA